MNLPVMGREAGIFRNPLTVIPAQFLLGPVEQTSLMLDLDCSHHSGCNLQLGAFM
jgi:hypothetical protein